MPATIVEFEEEVAEGLDGLVALGSGDGVAEGVEGGDEELDDLFGGVGAGRAFDEVVGVSAFEEPAGGSPVAVVLGGLADSADEFDVEIGFGAGHLVGELGVAGGGSGDGAGGAADVAGGDAAATADGEESDDLLLLVGVEDGGTAWGGHGWAPKKGEIRSGKHEIGNKFEMGMGKVRKGMRETVG